MKPSRGTMKSRKPSRDPNILGHGTRYRPWHDETKPRHDETKPRHDEIEETKPRHEESKPRHEQWAERGTRAGNERLLGNEARRAGLGMLGGPVCDPNLEHAAARALVGHGSGGRQTPWSPLYIPYAQKAK